MATEDKPERPKREIPPDSTAIKQSMWAWLWSVVPWIILALIFLQIDGTMTVFALILAVVVVLPRFLAWRNTIYYVSDDQLTFQRGNFFSGSQRYSVPISELRDVRARYGMFGKGLGYQAVIVVLSDGLKATLQYVPTAAELPERLVRLMATHGHSPTRDFRPGDSDTGSDIKE